MTTVVFGIYALAVLASLFTVGRLSDHVGRRPVLVVAVLVQAFTMLLFATADGLSTLIVARVIQGLSTGAALGAIGAGLVDLDRSKGTLANSVAPMLGTATGGMLSGLLVQYLPLPDKLIYGVLLSVFVMQAIGVALMPEPSQRRPGALASLRPQFSLPAELYAPMLVAASVAGGVVGFRRLLRLARSRPAGALVRPRLRAARWSHAILHGQQRRPGRFCCCAPKPDAR